MATVDKRRTVGKFVCPEACLCKVCNKRVYEMEKISADQLSFHKACFRCTHCKRVLTLGNYSAIGGNYYCKPHFISLFKIKGNYSEGFGFEKKDNPLASATSPDKLKSAEDSQKEEVVDRSVKSDKTPEEVVAVGNNEDEDEDEDEDCGVDDEDARTKLDDTDGVMRIKGGDDKGDDDKNGDGRGGDDEVDDEVDDVRLSVKHMVKQTNDKGYDKSYKQVKQCNNVNPNKNNEEEEEEDVVEDELGGWRNGMGGKKEVNDGWKSFGGDDISRTQTNSERHPLPLETDDGDDKNDGDDKDDVDKGDNENITNGSKDEKKDGGNDDNNDGDNDKTGNITLIKNNLLMTKSAKTTEHTLDQVASDSNPGLSKQSHTANTTNDISRLDSNESESKKRNNVVVRQKRGKNVGVGERSSRTMDLIRRFSSMEDEVMVMKRSNEGEKVKNKKVNARFSSYQRQFSGGQGYLGQGYLGQSHAIDLVMEEVASENSKSTRNSGIKSLSDTQDEKDDEQEEDEIDGVGNSNRTVYPPFNNKNNSKPLQYTDHNNNTDDINHQQQQHSTTTSHHLDNNMLDGTTYVTKEETDNTSVIENTFNTTNNTNNFTNNLTRNNNTNNLTNNLTRNNNTNNLTRNNNTNNLTSNNLSNNLTNNLTSNNLSNPTNNNLTNNTNNFPNTKFTPDSSAEDSNESKINKNPNFPVPQTLPVSNAPNSNFKTSKHRCGLNTSGLKTSESFRRDLPSRGSTRLLLQKFNQIILQNEVSSSKERVASVSECKEETVQMPVRNEDGDVFEENVKEEEEEVEVDRSVV